MDDFFGDDVWGEEPEWATESGGGEDASGEGLSPDQGAQGGVIGGQHVLMLIDCASTMFESFQPTASTTSSSPKSAMDMSLQVAENLLKTRIRNTITLKTGKRDGVGVLLFNTRRHRVPKIGGNVKGEGSGKEDKADEEEDDDDGIDEEQEEVNDDLASAGMVVHDLIKLAPPGIKSVKKVLACLEEDVYADMEEDGSGRRRRVQDLKGRFGSSASADDDDDDDDIRKLPLQVAIEEAVKSFQTAKCVKKSTKRNEPIDTKSVWIFTNNEDAFPRATIEGLRNQVRNAAGDATEQDISIVVWPLPSASQFDSAMADGKIKSEDDDGEDAEEEEDQEYPKIEFDYIKFFDSIVTSIPFQHRLLLDDSEAIDDTLFAMQNDWKKLRPSFRSPLFFPDWRDRIDGDDGVDSDSEEKKDEDKQANIMLNWYSLIQKQTKPRKVTIDQRTRLETVKTKLWMDENGTVFAKDKLNDHTDRSRPKPGKQRIREYVSFGGELIPLSSEDKVELTKQANAYKEQGGLTLLGFKNKNTIPFYHTLSKAYLIYPDDEVIQGSRKAFMHLHASMLRKSVVGIGEVLMRVQFKSRLAVIVPIEEEFENEEEGGRQLRAPGMMVKLLPFEDDLRSLEPCAALIEVAERAKRVGVDEMELDPVASSSAVKLEEEDSGGEWNNVASEDAISAAMNLIQHQTMEGHVIGEDFENAQLSRFINYLEAVALEIPKAANEQEYDIEVDDNDVKELVGDHIQAFLNALPEDEVKTKGKGQSKKRKVESDDSGVDWERLYAENSIASSKVDNLKKYLKSEGLPLGGRKADLVFRVENALAKKMKLGVVKMED